MDGSDFTTLGLLESGSIARGLAAQDAASKEAEIAPVWSARIEPGRHLFLFTGSVDAVQSALRRGRGVLGADLVDAMFLANAHPAVLASMGTVRAPAGEPASLGVIECRTIAATLLAADAAAKASEVELAAVAVDRSLGGKGLVLFTGLTADVESALTAGAEVAERHEALLRTEAIEAPSPGLLAAFAPGAAGVAG